MSRWNAPDVRQLAPVVRRGRSKGVSRALRQVKHTEAEARNAKTKRGRRRQARLKGEEVTS